MSFCPVCGANHDPKTPCIDRAGEILRDLGLQKPKIPEREFKNLVRKTNWSLIRVLLILIALVVMILISML